MRPSLTRAARMGPAPKGRGINTFVYALQAFEDLSLSSSVRFDPSKLVKVAHPVKASQVLPRLPERGAKCRPEGLLKGKSFRDYTHQENLIASPPPDAPANTHSNTMPASAESG